MLIGTFRNDSYGMGVMDVDYKSCDVLLADCIRWTRNDAGLELVNSRTAEVLSAGNVRVTFQLVDDKKLGLGKGEPQLRHLDHAWASKGPNWLPATRWETPCPGREEHRNERTRR